MKNKNKSILDYVGGRPNEASTSGLTIKTSTTGSIPVGMGIWHQLDSQYKRPYDKPIDMESFKRELMIGFGIDPKTQLRNRLDKLIISEKERVLIDKTISFSIDLAEQKIKTLEEDQNY